MANGTYVSNIKYETHALLVFGYKTVSNTLISSV